ncbi:LytTR family transcriptional regulator [Collinsella sp. AGMB00827]|uniref:LytTR family transcriptional regulator n=1 Tax=Collinsella ureilytica TaxID=2869515 RepID=A0ABS7MME0_9ACTN|nr:LytTR family DNA-binding domain-containing protein [Collinsella urealyticum]MBY4798218.1 LytTR family transcriptional regulator [Collinsella urealyticum]
MKITIKTDPSVTETSVTIHAREIDEEVERIHRLVSLAANDVLKRIVGEAESEARILDVDTIMRFHTEGRAVIAQTRSGSWRVRTRIKDLASSLDPADFVQINQGEIVNLNYVSKMDLSLSGTIRLRLADGTDCFVSRRSLGAFRQALSL